MKTEKFFMGECEDSKCGHKGSVRFVEAWDSFRCYMCWSSDEWLSERQHFAAKGPLGVSA